MDDLVKVLRTYPANQITRAELIEATDLIEQQAAENERLNKTNTALRNVEAQLQGEVNDLEAECYALKSHMERLREAGNAIRKPWDLSKILGAETRRLVEQWDEATKATPQQSLAERDADLFDNASIPKHAKSGCIGEFNFTIENGLCCPQCWHKQDDECDLCNGASGEGGYSDLSVTVPWDVCKAIWKAMNKVKAEEIRGKSRQTLNTL